MQDYYTFIVDTDSYAGNFEREMTAYATGVIGECGVGEIHALLFSEDYPDMDLSEYMYQKLDDDVDRPCSIVLSPSGVYDSVGMYFISDPLEYIDMIRERSLDFAKDNKIRILGFRLIHTTYTHIKPKLKI